jgi:hypothetical protein
MSRVEAKLGLQQMGWVMGWVMDLLTQWLL